MGYHVVFQVMQFQHGYGYFFIYRRDAHKFFIMGKCQFRPHSNTVNRPKNIVYVDYNIRKVLAKKGDEVF
jgi:hypothetical protein